MGYSINIISSDDGNVIELSHAQERNGSNIAIGGTSHCSIDITYNYARWFYQHVCPELGIRKLYGMTVQDSVPLLVSSMASIPAEEPSSNYWDATAGNARAALGELLKMAIDVIIDDKQHNAVWEGD